jgi:hypothetical protein
VWLTEDDPYDEMLNIYLIDPDGNVEDSVEAGATLGLGPSGIFNFLEAGEDWVEFKFFSEDTIYRLEVSGSSKVFRRLPEYWRYKKHLKKHILIVRELQRENTL